MPRHSNLKYADFDDNNFVDSGREAKIQEHLLEAQPDSAHARYLQQLLFQKYTETTAEEKLPRPQRLAIILGLTSGLWILIGMGAILAF